MEIVKCMLEDCGELAALNKQLIEDEEHDNPMSVYELKERMEQFLLGGYEAVYFSDRGNIIGYALIKMNVHPFYLCHFFICREQRKRGHGTEAFSKLMDYLGTNTIDIEVLAWNHIGLSFWKSLGFKPRSIYMRLENQNGV